MIIQHVPLEWVPRTWPRVEAFIRSALEFTDDYSVEEVKTLVATGHWMLLVAVDGETIHGAATVHFFNRPSTRVAMITAIGGRLVSSTDTFDQLKRLVTAFGATALEGAARPAIARLWSRYGFVEKYQIVGVKL
jgi:hypothetical protein